MYKQISVMLSHTVYTVGVHIYCLYVMDQLKQKIKIYEIFYG